MQLILNFKIFYKAVSAQRAHSRFQGNPGTLCTPRSHPIVPSEQSWCSSVDQGSEGMPQAPSIPRSPMHSQGEPGPCPCPCTSRVWNEQPTGPCGHPTKPHQPHLVQRTPQNTSGMHSSPLPKLYLALG